MEASAAGVLYGLAAAVGFGAADFAVTRVARTTGALRALAAVQLLGLVAAGAVAVAVRASPAPPGAAWGLMVLAAAVNFAGTLLLYRAFAVGTLAVVSPVASGFAVVTGLLAFAAGERPPGLVVVGAGLLVLGVAAVAGGVGDGAARSPAGVPEALGAALCLGVYFWALAGLSPALGWVWPVVVTRAVQLGLALVALRAGRGRVPAEVGRRRRPLLGGAAGATGLAVAGAALLDTAALVAFNLGLGSAYTTVTTALASLYSAVAALLAWALLRERLAPSQWAGVGVILAGVLLVSL